MRNSVTKKLFHLAVLVLSLGPMVLPSPTQAANNVEIEEKKVTITVLVELFGGTKELADRWGSAFSKYWNAGPNGRPFKYCGAEVLITTDIKVIPVGNYGTGSDHHIVRAMPYTGRDFRGCVRWGITVRDECPSDYVEKHYVPRPHEHNYSGDWGHRINPSKEDLHWEEYAAAHEFGHLLGLKDEYKLVTNKEGKTKTSPDLEKYPDGDQSIMGSKNGRVLQRHINEVMRKHDVYRRCKLIVDYDQEWLWGTTVITAHKAEVKMEFYEEVGGILLGTGTGVSKLTKTGPCRAEDEQKHEFEVNGVREGDHIQIELPLLHLAHNYDCGYGVTHVDRWWTLFLPGVNSFEGDLVNGRLVQTRDSAPILDTFFEKWTIEERLE